MKLWLDDIRPRPDGFELTARNARNCIRVLEKYPVTHISFDHDLGEEATGYDVAKWIERKAMLGKRTVDTWAVHSANPVGAANIRAAMERADLFLATDPTLSDKGE